MPGYGVETATDGLLSWAWAEDQLRTSHNFWLVTHWPDGRPHAVVHQAERQSPLIAGLSEARIVRHNRRQFRVLDGGRKPH